VEDAGAFRSAGRTLFSFGLVKGTEGNLSTYRDGALLITRTGSRLADLSGDDVVSGSLEGELPGGSSDLEYHRRLYAERGPGAVAHAHPPGTASDGPPGGHGLDTFAATLEDAVERMVEQVRGSSEARA
jgi:class II aldolase/adducin N-terminal domain-containing protein